MLTQQQKTRIKILEAIANSKKSGKKFVRATTKRIDKTAKTIPTKKNFEIEITNYITKQRK